jgi:hypothetical protein
MPSDAGHYEGCKGSINERVHCWRKLSLLFLIDDESSFSFLLISQSPIPSLASSFSNIF